MIRGTLTRRIVPVAVLSALIVGCAAPILPAPTSQPQVAASEPTLTSTATAEPAPPQPATPKRLVMRTSVDPDNLDPHLSTASLTRQIMLNVFEGLVKPTPDGGITPAVASEFTASEDGQTYTFTLREGVKFHNGQAVTAADIKYSFDRLMGKLSPDGKPLTGNLGDLESVETPDDKTVVMRLKQVNSTFVNLIAEMAILPAANDGKHTESPIGTGPYRFVSHEPQQRVVLEKFADYWQDTSEMIDQVEVRIINDDQTALLQLQSGAIDFTGVSAEQMPTLGDRFKVVSHPANSVFIFAVNHARAPYDSLKVRQALAHAIDKDAIIQAVFDGAAVKLGSNMSPVMAKYYREGLEDTFAYDPEKAKTMLAEAGFPQGFTATLTVSSHADLYGRTAQLIVDQLAKIGVQVQIETIEFGVWLERVFTNREFEMTLIDFTGRIDPQAVLGRYRSDFRRNFMNYKSEEFDKVLNEAVGAMDESTKIERYKRAQEILTQDVAAVYLADYFFNWAMRPDLEGYTPYPLFFHDLSKLRLK